MKLLGIILRMVKAPGDGRRGATIVEALVVLALFVLISVTLVSLYFQHGELYSMGQAQFESVASARAALNGISAYAVQARRVVASQTITGTLYTAGTSTLVLEIPSINENGDIIENTFDYAAFYTSSTALYRALAPSPPSARADGTKFLADNLTNLMFSYDNADFSQVKKVTVSVTSTTAIGRATEEHHESVELILRNY